MKYLFLIVAASSCCNASFAQLRGNIYADVAVNTLGASATYDHKIFKFLDLGVGGNVRYFSDELYNKTRSAVYVDLRPHIRTKKSLFFLPVDIGIGFLNGEKPKDADESANGLYVGMGIGYAYILNKRGMGPYITVMLAGPVERFHSYDMQLQPEARDYSVLNAEGVLSLGFRF